MKCPKFLCNGSLIVIQTVSVFYVPEERNGALYISAMYSPSPNDITHLESTKAMCRVCGEVFDNIKVEWVDDDDGNRAKC